MNITDLITTSLTLTFCVFALTGTSNVSVAQTEPVTWQVEIDVFSGRPNPVFKLDDPEVARVKELLSQAKVSTEARARAKVFPSVLGYRGTSIRQIGKDGVMQLQIRVRGKDILEENRNIQTWRNANDTVLEQYLADLALQKGAINSTSREYIRKAMEKAANAP